MIRVTQHVKTALRLMLKMSWHVRSWYGRMRFVNTIFVNIAFTNSFCMVTIFACQNQNWNRDKSVYSYDFKKELSACMHFLLRDSEIAFSHVKWHLLRYNLPGPDSMKEIYLKKLFVLSALIGLKWLKQHTKNLRLNFFVKLPLD